MHTARGSLHMAGGQRTRCYIIVSSVLAHADGAWLFGRSVLFRRQRRLRPCVREADGKKASDNALASKIPWPLGQLVGASSVQSRSRRKSFSRHTIDEFDVSRHGLRFGIVIIQMHPLLSRSTISWILFSQMI